MPREIVSEGQTVWLYLPSEAPRALIVVPPAGGSLLTAPGLGPADRAEHVPYVEAGFAVVSFSLSGELSGRVTREQVRAAVQAFAEARGGVADARQAVALVREREPGLAGLPVFAAGHSSAANLALALAAEDPEIEGVIAYAPVADTIRFVTGGAAGRVAEDVPGALELAAEQAPLALGGRISCPVLLFHAEDDDIARIDETRELGVRLERGASVVELVTTETGGHYDAMIREGLPTGIRWLGERLSGR